MRPPRLRSSAAACVQLFVLLVATSGTSDAQTWHWTYVTHTPNSPLAAQSSVAITAQSVHMAYILPLPKGQVVIESCSADLHDLQDATTIRTQGTTYLLIHFKPSRGALCAAGKRLAVALPGDDDHYVHAVAAAINRTCCTVARNATPAPLPSATRVGIVSPAPRPSPASSTPPPASPSPAPSPSPAATPSPAASPSPAAALQDWVENDGVFWFIRMRNSSRGNLTPEGEVFDCRNVDIGCGPFRILLEPGGTATVATIATANRGSTPSFRYRYTASDGPRAIAGSGSATKIALRNVTHMSARELRTAQALALEQLRSPRDAPAPITPVRLIKRGSSRLAIGQTGTALVRLMIAPNGIPEEATIVSITNKLLAAAAIETAVSSTYAPALQNGRAIEAKYVATFSFDGEDPALTSVPVWKRSPAPSASPASSASPPAASPAPSAAPASAAPSATPLAASPLAAPGATPLSASPSPASSAAPIAASPPPTPNATPSAPTSTGLPSAGAMPPNPASTTPPH
jgi:Gram-negative bacterial TonB protein C-terminal